MAETLDAQISEKTRELQRVTDKLNQGYQQKQGDYDQAQKTWDEAMDRELLRAARLENWTSTEYDHLEKCHPGFRLKKG